jgi:hypothetical protein
MQVKNIKMKLNLIVMWKLWSLIYGGQVSCMYIPSDPSNDEDADFNILVAGGNYFNDTWFSELSDVEIVNPFLENSTCQKPSSLPDSLDGPIIGNIGDVAVVCGGLKTKNSDEYGFEQTIESNCQQLQQNEWQAQQNSLNCPRWGASSVMINKDTMWVLGGNTDTSSSDECIDAAKSSEIFRSNELGEFEASVTLPEQMVYHCSARIDEHRIFVVNGYDENYEGISHAYIVDTSIEPFRFNALPSLNKVRSQAACGIITYSSATTNESENNLAIIVAGGGYGNTSKTTDIYRLPNDLTAEPNTWETGPILPRGFSNGCQINSDVNNLILIGGFDESGNVRSDLLHYNSHLQQFETLPVKLNTPRYGCSAVKMKNTGECVQTPL